jgi:hypothetical protein
MTGDPAGLTEAVMTHHPGSSVELMCHIGFVGEGGDEFNRSPDRESELAFICSRPFASLVDQGVVELAGFDEAFERGALC